MILIINYTYIQLFKYNNIYLIWIKRSSLIQDYLRTQGMAFLHSCEVGVHGKLRSSNCLIDGRFVLKLSNFGLRTLTSPSEVVHDSVYYHSKLDEWEILTKVWE